MSRQSGIHKGFRRWFLCWGAILFASVASAFILYTWWMQIPGTIHIRVGEEHTFDFHVPASGEIYLDAVAVSDLGETVTSDRVMFDLSEKVTMKSDHLTSYQMDVKLFGVMPLKQVNIQVIEDRMVMPAGVPIGIYVETEGVLVIGIGEFQGMDGMMYAPSKYILQEGDYILQVNDENVEGKKQFMDLIALHGADEVTLTVMREGQEQQLVVTPRKNESGEYKLGIWVRDNAQGVGTLTFVDRNGNFGALGHGINDVDTSELMVLEEGLLYKTEIIDIKKGEIGTPGELTGMISYSDSNVVGSILDNTASGIYGVCDTSKIAYLEEAIYMPIGLKQEIHKGKAQVITTVQNERETYDVEITEIRLDNDNVNRGIVLKITDPGLLNITGGIVQGMSGSPIVQDGRIIGAVTHVLVNDPTRGYGIFIENMLEH